VYLVDTDVLSELRRPRRNPNVVAWLAGAPDDGLYLSVITVGEIAAATALEHGLTVATRNVDDFRRAHAPVVNPFEAS
jgi:hypothetical protein